MLPPSHFGSTIPPCPHARCASWGRLHWSRAPRVLSPSRAPAQVLQNEQDLSTKRNAFQFLANHAEERAVGYLLSQIDNVALWGDILQMAVLDLIRKVALRPLQASGSSGSLVYPRSKALTLPREIEDSAGSLALQHLVGMWARGSDLCDIWSCRPWTG